jgi:hypothetical protein
MGQSKFTISLLGFDQRSAETLGDATSKTMKIVDPICKDDTQVVVVDIDGPEGMTIWDEFRQQWPNMPAVVASENEPDINHASFAEKPFTVEELIDNITEAIILAPSTEEDSEETPEAASELAPEEDTAAITDKPAIEEPAEDTDEPLPEDLADEVIQPNIDELMYGPEPDEEPAEIKHATNEETAEETLEDSDEAINEPAPDKALPPLSKIAGILSSHSSHSDSIIRKLDTPNPDESYFDPEAHIIGLVLKGIAEGEESGAIAKMACLLDKAIYIDARNKLVRSNLKDIHMRQIAIAPLGKGENGLDTELEMIEISSLGELPSLEGSVCPMEAFVWELAVLTSKGRAPIGTPMDEPTYLMQWPNFTRLMPIPYAMKVAAYWLRLPSSLNDLSENLDVPLCDILSLYSATSLTGLAGAAKRNSDKMLKPGKPEKHEKRSLFGTIMNSLKKNK